MTALANEITLHPDENSCDLCTHSGSCVSNARPCALNPDNYCTVCTLLMPVARLQINYNQSSNINDLQTTLQSTCNTFQYLVRIFLKKYFLFQNTMQHNYVVYLLLFFQGASVSEQAICTAFTNDMNNITGMRQEIIDHPNETPCEVCTHMALCRNISFPCAYIDTTTSPMTTTPVTGTTTTTPSIATHIHSFGSLSIMFASIMTIVYCIANI